MGHLQMLDFITGASADHLSIKGNSVDFQPYLCLSEFSVQCEAQQYIFFRCSLCLWNAAAKSLVLLGTSDVTGYFVFL